MKRFRYSPSVFASVLLLCSLLSAQQAAVSTSAAAVVPRLVNFSGKAVDQGKTITGITGSYLLHLQRRNREALHYGWRRRMCRPTAGATIRRSWARRRLKACRRSCLPRVKPDGWACASTAVKSSRACCCSAFLTR